MGRDLTARVQQQSQAVQQSQGQPTLTQLIERMKPEIARALPRHMDPDRITRIALTVLKQTPKLGDCDPATFLGALMTASQLGLEPGPLGEAYLVPYGRTVTFIPGYRGLAKLAWQSGQVESITAEIVGEHDEFDFQMGDDPHITHRPSLDDPGDAIAAYAVIRIKGGGVMRGVMSVAAIEKIRKRSRAAGSGPWVTDWDEMAKKTVLKRTLKLAPLSTELQTAAQLDGSVRTDVTRLEDAKVTPEHDLADQVAPAQVIEQTPAGPVDVATGELPNDVLVEDPPADLWPEVATPGGAA